MSTENTIRVRADEIRSGDTLGSGTVFSVTTTTTIHVVSNIDARFKELKFDPGQLLTVVRPNTAPWPR